MKVSMDTKFLSKQNVFEFSNQPGMGRKSTKGKSRWPTLPDGASTMQVMTIPEVDDHPVSFDEFSQEELHNLSLMIDQSNKTLEVENMVIERYLNRMDPTALANMDQIFEAATIALQKAERAAHLGGGSSATSIGKEVLGSKATMDSESMKTGTSVGTHKFGVFGYSDKGQRVQVAQKIEIVNREIDELKIVLENARKKARNFNYILRCHNEEMSARLQEIIDSQSQFEQKLLVDGVDPITGKLPGEKFIRYLESRLKAEEMEIDKMRIKTGSLRSHLKRVKQQLAQKEELGEALHAVDFEQLQIENRECQENLDEKVSHVIRLKRINGRYGNLLNVQKKKLEEQLKTLSHLQQIIVVKEKMIKKLSQDEAKVSSEVASATSAQEKITRLMNSYTVPEVMEYINKKVELHDLKKEIKVRERQIKLKDLVLASQLHKIKTLNEGFSKTGGLDSPSGVVLKESRIFF